MIDEVKKLRELTEALTSNGHLRDQAEEWRYALDSVPECSLIINTKGIIKFVNKMMMLRLGLNDKAEIYEENINTLIPDLKPTNLTAFNNKEIYIEKLNGWFKYSKSPIHSPSEYLLGHIIILKDITDVKVYREDLEEKEKKYRTLFESSPDALFVLDYDGSILEHNSKASDIFYTDIRSMSGKHILEVFKGFQFNTQSRIIQENLLAVRGCNEVTFELSRNCKMFGELFFLVRFNKMSCFESNFVLASVSDITSSKRLETDFNILSQNLRDIVWKLDLDMNFTFVSTVVYEMLGYTVEEFVGTNLSDHTTEKEFKKMKKIATDSLTDKNFEVAVFKSILKCKSGEFIEVEIHGKHIKDSEGNVVGLHGITIELCNAEKCAQCYNFTCLKRHRVPDRDLLSMSTKELNQYSLTKSI